MGPKKPDQPGEGGLGDELVEIEDYVKDYIVTKEADDPILSQYIALVRKERRTGIPIFTCGILDRPAFFENFLRPWILEGLQELDAMEEARQDALKAAKAPVTR